jgi:hypothetical protein
VNPRWPAALKLLCKHRKGPPFLFPRAPARAHHTRASRRGERTLSAAHAPGARTNTIKMASSPSSPFARPTTKDACAAALSAALVGGRPATLCRALADTCRLAEGSSAVLLDVLGNPPPLLLLGPEGATTAAAARVLAALGPHGDDPEDRCPPFFPHGVVLEHLRVLSCLDGCADPPLRACIRRALPAISTDGLAVLRPLLARSGTPLTRDERTVVCAGNLKRGFAKDVWRLVTTPAADGGDADLLPTLAGALGGGGESPDDDDDDDDDGRRDLARLLALVPESLSPAAAAAELDACFARLLAEMRGTEGQGGGQGGGIGADSITVSAGAAPAQSPAPFPLAALYHGLIASNKFAFVRSVAGEDAYRQRVLVACTAGAGEPKLASRLAKEFDALVPGADARAPSAALLYPTLYANTVQSSIVALLKMGCVDLVTSHFVGDGLSVPVADTVRAVLHAYLLGRVRDRKAEPATVTAVWRGLAFCAGHAAPCAEAAADEAAALAAAGECDGAGLAARQSARFAACGCGFVAGRGAGVWVEDGVRLEGLGEAVAAMFASRGAAGAGAEAEAGAEEKSAAPPSPGADVGTTTPASPLPPLSSPPAAGDYFCLPSGVALVDVASVADVEAAARLVQSRARKGRDDRRSRMSAATSSQVQPGFPDPDLVVGLDAEWKAPLTVFDEQETGLLQIAVPGEPETVFLVDMPALTAAAIRDGPGGKERLNAAFEALLAPKCWVDGNGDSGGDSDPPSSPSSPSSPSPPPSILVLTYGGVQDIHTIAKDFPWLSCFAPAAAGAPPQKQKQDVSPPASPPPVSPRRTGAAGGGAPPPGGGWEGAKGAMAAGRVDWRPSIRTLDVMKVAKGKRLPADPASPSPGVGGGGGGRRDTSVGGLSLLVRRTLGRPLDKRMQMTDWRRRPLYTAQAKYAALDAYVLPRVLDALAGLPGV